MNSMQASETTKPAQDIAVAFGNTLAQSLSGACESTWTVAPSGQSVKPETGATLYFRVSFSGSVETEMFFGVEPGEIQAFGFRDLPQTGSDSQDENVSALQAVLDAATRALPGVLSGNSAPTVQVERVATPKLPDEHVLELVAQTQDAKTSVSIKLFFDQALVTAIAKLTAQAASHPAVEFPAATNLDLVLDVELNVTLRFGQRQLSLREVLELTSGSVVELDRQVDEPVDLFLDGKVVARGEAVIIDGNYGMRITQVLQPLVA
jgi:flagellar motor switch protein FliN/FliY